MIVLDRAKAFGSDYLQLESYTLGFFWQLLLARESCAEILQNQWLMTMS